MDLVIDYDGKARYASLTRFDWFEVEWDAFFGEQRFGYVPVTQSFLDNLRSRVAAQRERSDGYSETMLERLALAEKLLSDLEVKHET
jgi:hypothetical protein